MCTIWRDFFCDKKNINRVKGKLYDQLLCKAIDTFQIREISILYSYEYFCQRLSFYPLHIDTPESFEFSFTGPMKVYSSMVKYFVCQDILIIDLKEGERIDCTIIVTMGSYSDHAKFGRFVYLPLDDVGLRLEYPDNVYSEKQILELLEN